MKAVFFPLKTLLLSLLLCAGSAFANDVVNINTADAEALSRVLVNVGPAKAQAIVEHRQQHGPFKSVEELVNVRGIGLATVERNMERMTVGGGGNAAPRQGASGQGASSQAAAPASAPRRPAGGGR